ncbi:hypothetical protein DFJ74DRAFT_691225 [Hyaloraphidium curvatum]|nr:hypothetical protein DFJ74DRAFT_691225 [Hyaloraphidium curvatum]
MCCDLLLRAAGFTTYDRTAFGVLCRWRQLVEETEAATKDLKLEEAGAVRGETPSPLIQHDPGDALCPCPSDCCGGGLFLRGDATERLMSTVLLPLPLICVFFFALWTPLVTLAGRFWGSWGAVGAAGCILMVLVRLGLFAPIRNLVSHTVSSASLSRRLYRRALAMSLRSFLQRYRARLAPGPGGASDDPGAAEFMCKPPASELHVSLCQLWIRGLGAYNGFFQRLMACTLACLVLSLLITLASGPCISAYQILGAAAVLSRVTYEMLVYAAYNGQADDVVSLCSEALEALASIAGEAACASAPDHAALASIRAHEKLLALFVARADRRRTGCSAGASTGRR